MTKPIFSVNDRVNRKNTDSPTGIIESLNEDESVTVRWGVQDRNIFREDVPQDQLEISIHKVVSDDELIKRQEEESGLVRHNIFDKEK